MQEWNPPIEPTTSAPNAGFAGIPTCTVGLPPDLKDRVAALERNTPHVHPAIHNLFALLPSPGAQYSAADRVNFLKAAACLFHMIYGATDPLQIKAISDES